MKKLEMEYGPFIYEAGSDENTPELSNKVFLS